MAEGTEISSVHVVLSADGHVQTREALVQVLAAQKALAGTTATAKVTVEDAQAKQKLAEFRAMTQAMNAVTARIRVEAQTSQAIQDLSRFKAETDRINALTVRAKIDVDTRDAEVKVAGLTDKLARFVVAGAGFAAGNLLAKGIGEATDAVVGFNGRLEQTETAFSRALGSQSAADQFIGKMKDFAKATPFQFEDVTKYSLRLEGVGFAARKIIPDLQAMGDAVAGTGGGKDELDHVTLALGQMHNSLHLNAQDMNQLVQANIPAWALLAEQIGVTQAKARQMAESGQISGEQGAEAIIAGMAARFGGAMDAQSKTMLGRLSNLKDSVMMTLADVGKPVFTDLSGELDKIAAGINSERFKEVATEIAGDIHLVVVAGEAVVDVFGKIPAPVLETALRLGEAAVAVKLLTTGYGFARTAIAPMVALFTTETAAVEAETVALTTNAAAWEARGIAQGAASKAGDASTAAGGAGSGLGKAGLIGGILFSGYEAAQYAANRGFNAFRGIPVVGDLDELAMRTGLIGNRPGLASDFLPARGQALSPQAGVAGGNLPASFQALMGPASEAGAAQLGELIDQVKSGAITADSARGSFDLLARTFGRFVPDIAAVRQGFEDQLTPAIVAHAKAMNDAKSAVEQYQSNLVEASRAQAMGVDNETISRGIFGRTGEGDTATQSQVSLAQKRIQDFAAAYRDAGTAIAGVDLTKGFDTLTSSLPALTKARDELAAIGKTDPHVSALISIATEFKDIADAENRASLAFSGYMDLYSESDQTIKRLEAIKSAYDDAADAAAKKRAAGGALTPDEADLIANRPTVDANADAQIGRARTRQAGDLTQAIQVVPDWGAYEEQIRQKVRQEGGAEQLAIKVNAETTRAQEDIKTMLALVPPSLSFDISANFLPPDLLNILKNIPSGLLPALGIPGTTANPPPAGYTPSGMPPAANPVGWNQFQPLSMEQFSAIANSGAQGGASPWANDPNMYAAVLAAAQKYGVDPRVLLAWTKEESGNGSTSSAALNAINNFGGIQFAGQPGAADAGFAEPGHSRDFAAFSTPQDFFNALAANLSTDNYRNLYDKGDLIGVSKQYAESPGTRVQDYADYATRYPAAQGSGGAAYDDPRFGKATGGAGQKIVDAAMADVGMKAFIEQCERWIEEKVQQATGRRGATGQNETNAATALSHAQSLGLEVNTPQEGDLVYYASSPNSPDGHVAIYVGAGRQVSTEDAGGTAIHTEAVGAGAHYIRVPGVAQDAIPTNAAAGGNVNLADPTSDAARAEIAKQKIAAEDARQTIASIGSQARVLQGVLQDLTPKGGSDLVSYFDKVYAAEQKAIEEGMKAKSPTGTLAPAQQTAANNQALAATGDLTILAGRAMLDLEHHSADAAADIQKIRDYGGPVASNLAEQVGLWGQIQANTAKVAQDQASIASLDLANTARKQREQADDETASRQKTRDSWTQELSDRSQQLAQQRTQYEWTLDAQNLDARKTAEERIYEDAATGETRAHALKMDNLDDELAAAEKLQKTADSGNSALEQALSYQAKGPGDLATKFQGAELLAIQKDFDSRNRQTLSDQIAGIKDAQVAENRLYETDVYNRDQLHTKAVRDFADEATRADVNHTRIQQQWQQAADAQWTLAFNTKVKDQNAAWALADQRTAADALYVTNKAIADATLKRDQDHGKSLDAQLLQVQTLDGLWGSVFTQAGNAANVLLAAFSQMTGAAASGPAPIRKLGQSIPAGNYGVARGA